MRSVYRVLAYLVAIEVAIQAAVMVFAIAGLLTWITGGGVLDQAAIESEAPLFPEAIGFFLHGTNGMMVIPALALILLVVSFFAKIPGGVKWAAAVLGLVVLQVALGIGGHSAPIFGLLHGLNALALFTVALLTGRRAKAPVVTTPAAQRTSADAMS